MKKRRLMLDGARVGTELEGSIEVRNSEVNRIQRILVRAGAVIDENGDLSVIVANEEKGSDSKLMVSLRPHYHKEVKKVYLNISGNPLAFITGSSNYGYAEADRVMITAYRIALETIGEFPKRIMQQIAKKEVFIYSLEFAAYTNNVPDKEQLLSDWNRMYSISCHVEPGGKQYNMVTRLLKIRHEKANEEHKSLCLRLMTNDSREESVMLMAYDKADEIRNKAKRRGVVGVVPSDIESRLRIDMNLCRGWFRTHQVGGKKLKTLSDLVGYIEKNYKGSWVEFLTFEFDKAIARSRLFYMWSFDVEAGLKAKDKVDLGLAISRALLRASSLQVAKSLSGDTPLPKVGRNPHPYELKLDLGTVQKEV